VRYPALAKILVLDDDAAIARLCRIALLQEGHDVTALLDAVLALERVKAAHFDVVVLDLQMPVMSGREFFHSIENDPDRPKVLLLSANGADQARRELGAEASMEKPFDPLELARRVNELAA